KFNEDKPWKHHSDRWTITDQERKRYEGVWVTNRGSYMDMVDPSTLNSELDVPGALNTALKATMLPNESSGSDALGPQLSNLMLNVVAREIWQRSKLPNDLLRQVWDLVDTRHDGTLDRTSFIVGMWLVDQCLYGRKLPKAVNDEVWNSV
ncbi:EF-hand, partial [Cyberlindnera jadinii NRRL Y-1542]